MQVARSRTPGAHAELAGEMRFGAGGKGAHLLVAHVDPCYGAVVENCIGEAIQSPATP